MALQTAFPDAAFDLREKMGRSGGRLGCLECGSHCLCCVDAVSLVVVVVTTSFVVVGSVMKKR